MNSFAQYDFFYQKVSDENVAINVTLNASLTLIVADAMYCIIMIFGRLNISYFDILIGSIVTKRFTGHI